MDPRDDRPDLVRFVSAQDEGGTYDDALRELRGGHKRSHWMWFVFPQVQGLGRSETARFYAVAGLDEARAYLAHPVLGARLRECCRTILDLEETSAEAVFGSTDAMKLRSSMTLFMRAEPDEPLFAEVLEKFFGGEPDEATDAILDRAR
ncbi:DUF1810 domain-containing protein [Nocardioides sp. Soil805]|uniref:DUF1810 domain-containing protein n=1 Tax=Nocardioides sp. Soil805 TaxID=1736416 RepID=UPI0007026022|nr:DUF1810 domain-containing protein [Nocardioides sp. Soil805]KRF34664.1 calpastatin [Nocardioides sp. Soil805]